MPANAKKPKKPKLIAVVGATSTGKTAFAIALAKRIGGEVISADSRQVYRGLDLGTGKVTKKEMSGIAHHLIDIAPPSQIYTAGRYVRDARAAIAQVRMRGKVPILCGGTGFYIDMALGRMLAPEVPPNPVLRSKLAKQTPLRLFAMLKKLDPKRAATIDPHNPVRLIRAIEIAKALGHVPMTDLRNQSYDVLTLGLTLPDAILKKRIAARLKSRLRRGMLAEARRLYASGVSLARMEMLGLEYRYMARHLSGKLSRKQMEEELLREIVRYAKRQKTWFKRDPNTIWLSPKEISKAAQLAKDHLG